MRADGLLLAGLVQLALAGSLAGPLAAQDPLSAIDWLDRQPQENADFGLVPDAAALAPQKPEPPVTKDATRPEIIVEPLDAPTVDAVGLLPPHVTGFPQTLWRNSDTAQLADLLIAQNVDGQPAMQSLLFALLLAEALPPEPADGKFLVARIDRLIAMGAIAQAAELLALTDAKSDPALFARVLDLSLLAGPGVAACEVLAAQPHLAPGADYRVYCLAQSGNWDLALTTLITGEALGDISPAQFNLLLAFLDPELAEEVSVPPPSLRMSPLEYRLHEAMGEPVPTHTLPRAFANADLPGDSGWKAQIEAAERLVRAGAISEQRLFAFYTANDPSASGGVWDRAEAVQRFERALGEGDAEKIDRALRQVWAVMSEAGLLTAFAKAYGDTLASVELTGTAAGLQMEAALLSPNYERLSRRIEPRSLLQKFAVALAQGRPDEATAPSPRARAIAEGFANPPPAHLQALLNAGRLGEVILRAMSLAYQGHLGDDKALAEALSTFRAVGLEDTARRAALQSLLLAAEG
ncbi:hypothetical protein [Marinovum sp.]|uniref:hypothetical protein n=1 Tax=Marinovum sp. TaxID=2024839 RepID=UPI003A918431